METVIVIGGGASGMMAALTAAESGNRRVVLLERQNRLGRKLLSTGNGRCNLTNMNACRHRYHGAIAGFTDSALEGFTPMDTLRFFRALGLLTVTESDGRVYPLSDSANSVLDVLRFALDRAGVEQYCSCTVTGLDPRDSCCCVKTDSLGQLSCDYLILACGGAAGAKVGGWDGGYRLACELGLRPTALHPALTPVYTEGGYPKALKGVRADAALRLLDCNGGELGRSEGELQFTDTGVSGPAAFDLSRAASVYGAGAVLSADFLRDYSAGEALSLMQDRRRSLPELPCSELFTGMLHNRLGRMLVKYGALDMNAPLGGLSDEELSRAAAAAKDFRLTVAGVGGFEQAQVTAGGIDLRGVRRETLETRTPGVFICGELLDIDGDCGGYNLQWAWSSGRLAGRLGR